MHENEISEKIIGSSIAVHRELALGLLESSYQECLFYELAKSGVYVEKQKALPLGYKKVRLDCGYRLDLLVENKVVVEIKSVDQLHDIHLAQTLTYLKISGKKLGLLINFNVVKLKDGVRRVVNKL